MGTSFHRLSQWLGRWTGRRSHGPGPITADGPFPAGTPVETQAEPQPDRTEQTGSSPAPEGSQPALTTGHELIRRIGKGAYGEVWLGRDELHNYHAVKLVRRDRFADKAPFEREYRGLLQYTPISRTHHGLVHILNVGRDNAAGTFFYVMELADCMVRGREIHPDDYSPHSLEQAILQHGRLPLDRCVNIGLELCEGLAYLHSKQLIHRDIKPANIVFVNGMAKLADVGLITHMAEARRDSKHLGTEGFIPPEGPGTPLADVYSLGKVLTEAAFGTPTPPAPETIEDPAPARFAEIMSHACHDDPTRRSASPEALQTELMDLHDQLTRRPQP